MLRIKNLFIGFFAVVPFMIASQPIEAVQVSSMWNCELLEDNQDNYWFYSDKFYNKGRLVKFDGQDAESYKKIAGANTIQINSVFEYNNEVYFSIYKKLFKYENEDFVEVDQFDGLDKQMISFLYKDSKDRNWLGAGMAFKGEFGQLVDNEYRVEMDQIKYPTAIFEDKDQNIWIGEHLGGVKVLKGEKWTTYTRDQLGFRHINEFTQDMDGNIWASSIEGTVAKFDGKNWESYKYDGGYFYWYAAGPGMILGILPGVIFGYAAPDLTAYTKVVVDRENVPWTMVAKRGVYQIVDGEFIDVQKKYDLPNLKTIKDIMRDDRGNIWLSVNKKGIMRFDGNNWEIYNVFEGEPIFPMAVKQDKKGNIWALGNNRIYRMQSPPIDKRIVAQE